VPSVNSPLFPIIRRCLEKEPSERYQRFAELRHDLKNLLIIQFPVARPGSIAHAMPSEIVTDIFDQYEPVLEAWEWENKGLSLYHLGYFAQALGCFERSIEINPHSAPAWNNRGMGLYQLGRYREAVNCFDEFLQMDPGHAHAWNNRGLSLSGMGLWDEALRSYERALQIDPQDAWFWYHKAITEDALGHKQEAANSFKQFLARAPLGYPAQTGYAQKWLSAFKSIRTP
jgi:tetratricopeptide (TPR) repeat protein